MIIGMRERTIYMVDYGLELLQFLDNTYPDVDFRDSKVVYVNPKLVGYVTVPMLEWKNPFFDYNIMPADVDLVNKRIDLLWVNNKYSVGYDRAMDTIYLQERTVYA
jgi:hypothetical protein